MNGIRTEENPQEEAEKIDEINAIAAEIAEAREKIKRLKGVIKCENVVLRFRQTQHSAMFVEIK